MQTTSIVKKPFIGAVHTVCFLSLRLQSKSSHKAKKKTVERGVSLDRKAFEVLCHADLIFHFKKLPPYLYTDGIQSHDP
jgi:hypothetical protein